MGRRPTPLAELERRGSWRAKARANETQVKPTAGVIEPMQNVRDCPRKLELFNDLVALLTPQGFIGTQDGLALSMLAGELELAERARAGIEATGGMVLPNGRVNPWLRALQNANRAAFKMMLAYGMTPDSRAHLGTPAPPTETGADRLKARFTFIKN
jgi:hypothetical protein